MRSIILYVSFLILFFHHLYFCFNFYSFFQKLSNGQIEEVFNEKAIAHFRKFYTLSGTENVPTSTVYRNIKKSIFKNEITEAQLDHLKFKKLILYNLRTALCRKKEPNAIKYLNIKNVGHYTHTELKQNVNE